MLNFLDYRIQTIKASESHKFSTIPKNKGGVSAMSFDTIENRL